MASTSKVLTPKKTVAVNESDRDRSSSGERALDAVAKFEMQEKESLEPMETIAISSEDEYSSNEEDIKAVNASIERISQRFRQLQEGKGTIARGDFYNLINLLFSHQKCLFKFCFS